MLAGEGDLLPQNTPASKYSPNTVDRVLAYSKRFLFYGFAISLLVHGTLGPLVEWKPQALGTPEPLESVSITNMPHTPEPTPVPTQSATPSPARPRPRKIAQFLPTYRRHQRKMPTVSPGRVTQIPLGRLRGSRRPMPTRVRRQHSCPHSRRCR